MASSKVPNCLFGLFVCVCVFDDFFMLQAVPKAHFGFVHTWNLTLIDSWPFVFATKLQINLNIELHDCMWAFNYVITKWSGRWFHANMSFNFLTSFNLTHAKQRPSNAILCCMQNPSFYFFVVCLVICPTFLATLRENMFRCRINKKSDSVTRVTWNQITTDITTYFVELIFHSMQIDKISPNIKVQMLRQLQFGQW